MPVVTFDTFDPAEMVAQYYLIQFDMHKWKIVRDGLSLELTNGGGDWIRVYQKGTALVHIHIVGPWKLSRQERIERATGTFSPRRIILKFIGIAPSDVLGNTYQDKMRPDLPTDSPASDGHPEATNKPSANALRH